MPIQTSYGVEVDNDIFAAIDAQFRERVSACDSAYRPCSQNCEQYVWYDTWTDCRERCTEAHSSCLMTCWRLMERDIRRFGRPIGGANGNPMQALTNVKFTCQTASDEFDRAAKVFEVAGIVATDTMGDVQAGVMMGITGMLMDFVAWRLEQIAIDPPAEDYQDVFGPRDIAITDVTPAVPIGSSSLFSDFLPLIAPNIASGTLLEAMSVALDRAAYANEVDAEEPYFMQLRVSQGFANGCAWSLQQSQEGRLAVVDRLSVRSERA